MLQLPQHVMQGPKETQLRMFWICIQTNAGTAQFFGPEASNKIAL